MTAESQNPAPVVVVDVGSGAVKLLLAERREETGSVETLFATSAKTTLFSDGGGVISGESLAATADAFDSFIEEVTGLVPAGLEGVSVSVVATAVARSAKDLSQLQDLVSEKFGVELQILTGEREAELAFLGAVHDRKIDGPVTVIDIGSGSTEVAMRADPSFEVIGASVPVGGRSLTELYLTSDPPRPDELSSALSVVELYVDDVRRALPGLQAAIDHGTVVATGAMTQIAAVEIGLTDPLASVDGEVVEKAGVEDLFRAIATESSEDRRHNPGLKPEHVDDIVGATCVLLEFMRQFGVQNITVSERGVRYGLAVELLGER